MHLLSAAARNLIHLMQFPLTDWWWWCAVEVSTHKALAFDFQSRCNMTCFFVCIRTKADMQRNKKIDLFFAPMRCGVSHPLGAKITLSAQHQLDSFLKDLKRSTKFSQQTAQTQLCTVIMLEQ
jgi:hypothetical protein